MLKRTLPSRLVCVLLLGVTCAYAQKEKTLVGDAWIGTVEHADEATREIKLVNPNKKTETFVGFLIAPYIVRLKDGALREVQFSEIKPGMRVRAFYKSKTDLKEPERTAPGLGRLLEEKIKARKK